VLAWKLPSLPVKRFRELSRPNIMMHTPAWSGDAHSCMVWRYPTHIDEGE